MVQKMFTKSTKKLLQNVIRHTGFHNRLVEEGDMWSQHDLQKGNDKSSSKNSFLFDTRADWYDERRNREGRTAHMDMNSDLSHEQKSTYWIRQLQKTEEVDPDRWGHSGFKEMYPADFDSDRSASTSDDKASKRKKKHAKKKKKHKKEKRKRKHSRNNDSDSDIERSVDDRVTSKERRKRDKYSDDSRQCASLPEVKREKRKRVIDDNDQKHRKKKRRSD